MEFITDLLYGYPSFLGHEPMASLQSHLEGGSYATLAAVAAQMNRRCELCPAELTMFRVSDLVHTFYA